MAVPTNPFVKMGPDTGKLVEIIDDRAVVEFFDAPVPGGSIRDDVPVSRLYGYFLEPQTRVWWEQDGQWRAGRVLAQPAGNSAKYLIGLTDKVNAEVEPERLNVRWSRPLVDPVRMLEARVADLRFFHRTRSEFLKEVLKHRAAIQGLAGITSSSVRIHRHQVLAARRVLRDPVRRYLLADEVGLGKTIEAGMVIRQVMLEIPGTRVVVTVPEQLVSQWEDELASKFAVNGLNGGSVEVISHAQLIEGTWNSGVEPGVLVIDEAHRLVDNEDADDFLAVCEPAHLTPVLLLLSATPARTNEEAFLRMLHLLDPASYRIEDTENFRQRILSRDEIGAALTLLRDGASTFLFEEAAERLMVCFPHDEQLAEMAQAVFRALEADDDDNATDAAQVLRNYVSDTYRLHRRMIRTRREGELEAELPVRGRAWSATRTVTDLDTRRPAIITALDSFRGELVAATEVSASDLLRVVASRCSSGLSAIRELVRLIKHEGFDGANPDELLALRELQSNSLGVDLADELDRIVQSDDPDGRLTAMTNWASPHIGHRKVAALTSYSVEARAAFDAAVERFGGHRVAGLLSEMSREELAVQYERILRDDLCNILICDSIAEEGFNLQFIDEILHLDLPWSASRLEQRLGRFDRFAADAVHKGPIRSTVCVDESELHRLSGAWLDFVDVAFDIFGRSTAVLQFVLPETEEAAIGRVLDGGFDELRGSAESERERLDSIRRAIEGQDLLDAVESDREESAFFENLVSVDKGGRRLGSAVSDWVGRTFNLHEEKRGSVSRFTVDKQNVPQITESEMQRIGIPVLNKRFSADRTQVGIGGVNILRPGYQLVDRVFEFTETDGRGTSFAVAKESKAITPELGMLPFFYFDFYVQPSMTTNDESPNGHRVIHARALEYFPAMVERIWFSRLLGEPVGGVVRQLEGEYDVNLAKDPNMFTELTAGIDWSQTCRDAEIGARGVVESRESVISCVQSARARLDGDEKKAIARGHARNRALGESFEEGTERGFFDAVRLAVLAPSFTTISCGVVLFLTPGTISKQ